MVECFTLVNHIIFNPIPGLRLRCNSFPRSTGSTRGYSHLNPAGLEDLDHMK
jgi:hypothetical protein